MQITVNGQQTDVADHLTVAALIETLGYAQKLGAVAVNMTFVPLTAYGETVLKEGDNVEILAPVSGG